MSIDSNFKRPYVGIGVFVFKDGKFLMNHRVGSHGHGSWCLPGGHLEFGESFADTAVREVLEETGVNIKNIRFGAVTNDYFREEGKHYVTIWILSDYDSGEPQILEPEKSVDQGWFDFDSMPQPLFLPFKQLFESEFIDKIRNK